LGTREELATRACPFPSKNFRKLSRISLPVIVMETFLPRFVQ